jgi:ABC-2 type transport system permease protein
MRPFRAIYLRELKAYFHSPIAYVLMVGFLALTGYFFYSAVAMYSVVSLQAMQNPMLMKMNLTDMLVSPLLSNMSIILMLISPLLTMRLVAEEKKTGTVELLLTYPLTDTAVVLAKFLAAWTMLAVMLALTGVQMAVLFWLGEPHLPAVLSGYLGLLLMSGAFAALGLFASAATSNQIVAAVVSYCLLLILWVLGWSANVVGAELGAWLQQLSLGGHFEGFARGLLDTHDVVYYLLFVGFFLFLSIRVLEANRWKA